MVFRFIVFSSCSLTKKSINRLEFNQILDSFIHINKYLYERLTLEELSNYDFFYLSISKKNFQITEENVNKIIDICVSYLRLNQKVINFNNIDLDNDSLNKLKENLEKYFFNLKTVISFLLEANDVDSSIMDFIKTSINDLLMIKDNNIKIMILLSIKSLFNNSINSINEIILSKNQNKRNLLIKEIRQFNQLKIFFNNNADIKKSILIELSQIENFNTDLNILKYILLIDTISSEDINIFESIENKNIFNVFLLNMTNLQDFLSNTENMFDSNISSAKKITSLLIASNSSELKRKIFEISLEINFVEFNFINLLEFWNVQCISVDEEDINFITSCKFKNNDVQLIWMVFLYSKLLYYETNSLKKLNYLKQLLEYIFNFEKENKVRFISENANHIIYFNMIQDIKKVLQKELIDSNHYFEMNGFFNSLKKIIASVISIYEISLNYNEFCLYSDDIIVEDQNSNDIISLKDKKLNLNLIIKTLISSLDYFNKELKQELYPKNELEVKISCFVFLQNIVHECFTSSAGLMLNKSIFSDDTLSKTFTLKYLKIVPNNSDKTNGEVNIGNEKTIKSFLLNKIINNSFDILNVNEIKPFICLIFKENEIYNLIKSLHYSKLCNFSQQLEKSYKKTILDEEKIDSYLSKLQNEDQDYLEEVVKEIFSKEVLEFIRYPEEIINHIQSIFDELRYNLSLRSDSHLNDFFAYYSIWKSIMCKIEYGLKLFTSHSSYAKIIENYNTILKFIIDYFTSESGYYEVFLIQTLNLIQIIESKLPDNVVDEIQLKFDKESFILDPKLIIVDGNIFNADSYKFLIFMLYKFMKIFPNLVRFWYNSCNGKIKMVFKNLVYKVLFPNIIKEFTEVISDNKSLLVDNKITINNLLEDLKTIVLTVDINEEISFKIEIIVPNNFPLSKMIVNLTSNAFINKDDIFQMNVNLNNIVNMSSENICDNLILWSQNCKKYICDGREPCPICYYQLHCTNKALPDIKCRTCKKVFHSLCIREWFKNSVNTTCPMCRSKWVDKGKRNF